MSRTIKSEMYACAVLLILVRVVCAQECSTCKDGADGHSSKCSNTGKCNFGCIDGYYGNNCLHNCTYQNCLSCYQNTGHYCSKCKSGYYLLYTYCHPCNSKCKSCDSIQRCLSCYDGYWGSTCQNKCSSGCKNGHCDEESGTCRCSLNYKGEKCDQCANGWFGQPCQYECSRDCKNGYCDKESAVCRCSPNYKGETCDQCSNGHFGKYCQYLCSGVCKNGHCDKESAVCRCSPNYKGETCDQCSNGRFGEKCEHNCSLGCEFGICTRETGSCPCKSEWSGQRCETKTETNVEHHTQSIAALSGGVAIFAGIVVIGRFLLRRRLNRQQNERIEPRRVFPVGVPTGRQPSRSRRRLSSHTYDEVNEETMDHYHYICEQNPPDHYDKVNDRPPCICRQCVREREDTILNRLSSGSSDTMIVEPYATGMAV